MGFSPYLALLLALFPAAHGAEPGAAPPAPASSSPAAFDFHRGDWDWRQPAQQAAARPRDPVFRPPDTRLGTERNFFRNLVYDQKTIWTSPFHVRANDARWLVPFGAATGGLIASDARAMQLERSRPQDIETSDNVANGGLAGLGAVSLGLYAWGRMSDNPHARETGVLATEAVANGLVVTGFLKAVTWRERPDFGDGRGGFFAADNPRRSSFPSVHALTAWSAASVIAHEYPGWFTRVAAYGTATAVSVARVSGRRHFPSDVVVASTLGWLIGRQVYRAHHDPDLGGESFGVFTRADEAPPRNIGSPYVPLDSWIYPALMRLAGMGYIHTQSAGMQPWTRLECHRQVIEARGNLSGSDVEPAAVVALVRRLEEEFAYEDQALEAGDQRELALDSVYFRYTDLSGTPLRDGFHFGRSIVNDFGRPFAHGSNVVTGITAHAIDGRFSYFLRAEYQHAPSSPLPR